MDVQVQVAGQITSKPTANGGTKFDIPLSNGMKASTFDVSLATKVSQFGGQVFTARLEQKPNPRGGAPYTNITAVAGAGEQLTPEIPQAGTPIGQAFPPTATATPIVPAPQGGMSPEREIKIVKQSMLAAAANLVGHVFAGSGVESLEEAEQHVERIAKGWFGHVFDVAKPEQQPAESPAAVAAFVADQAGAPVVQVGTDGVTPAASPAVLPWTTGA